MYRKKTVLLFTVLLVFSCLKRSDGLKKEDVKGLIYLFLDKHVRYNSLSNTLSKRTLENFINKFDYGKYFFYAADIERFQKYRDAIGNLVLQEQYPVIDEIYGVFKKRFAENMKLFDELIKSDFDFNKDEEMVVDREKIEYAKTNTDMAERWRKSIKLQLLNYISTGMKINDAKGKLAKKYDLLKKRIEELDDEELYSRFLDSVTTALDPHSNYMTPDENEDFKISMELKLEGIGVRLKSEDGFVIVESIITGGAADRLPENLKLKPGDKIVGVAQAEGEPVDVIDMDLRDVVKKIRGKKGTEVRLTILRATETSKQPQRMLVPIVREEIRLKDSDAESEIHVHEADGVKVNIGYIKLPSFYFDPASGKTSSSDIRKHLKKLKESDVQGIVLDLRGNPGGGLNDARDIASFLLDEGPILLLKESRHSPQVLYDNYTGMVYEGPLVILFDRFSASASEILAGAIRDYHRGLLIGPTPTYGKGTVQSKIDLAPGKGAIKITTHIFYQPGGTSNQLNGIEPDIVVPDISSVWDIGENKSRFPLVWEKIERADFRPFNYVTADHVTRIRARSIARVNQNKEFQTLIDRINRLKKQISKKTISLKEESDLEKQRMKEFEKTMKNERDKKLIDLQNDLFLKEAFNITHDYIRMLGK